MRKRKVTKIDNKEFTVFELRPRDILEIFDSFGDVKGDVKDDLTEMKDLFTKHLPILTDAKPDDLMGMGFSEIALLYDDFKEVNEVFFGLAQRLKLGEILEKIKEAITADFYAMSADLFKQGIAKPGITDTPSSSSQPENSTKSEPGE